jgi:rhamnosyltransferase subunit B
LSGLAREHDIAAYVGGLSETARAALAARHLWLASEPIDLAAAALQSDALLCHAGAGSAPIALAAGKPVLLLPYSAEQQVNAIRIAATGAGLQLTETLASGAFAGEVARFLAGPEGPAAAQALARRWSGRPDAVRVAVEHVMRLAGA